MKTEIENVKIADLLQWQKDDYLKANPEYQRGLVWKVDQRKRLIDSVLRGYPLPLIYLHRIVKHVAGLQSVNLQIIDGQQRINALYDYWMGAFDLFDPIVDEAKARFPHFIRDQDCPWARRRFQELGEDLRQAFIDRELPVAYIETDVPGEARDLFVRLQAGTPLTAQEKRDAWPGNMNEFILRTAGKPELPQYQGHEFFRYLMGAKQGESRTKLRQFCAQWLLLYLNRRKNGNDAFCDIGTEPIDDVYYQHLDFDLDGADAKRFRTILDQILSAFLGEKFKPLKGSEALHLVLLVDSLLDDYTLSWKDELFGAYEKFMRDYALAKSNKYGSDPGHYWTRYGQLTRTGSDSSQAIRIRHEFFCERLREFMPSLQLKDPRRLFGQLEKELIYLKAGKRCAVCNGSVSWQEAEIHHLLEHHQGGQTNLSNGVLVHAQCHPKGSAALAFRAERVSSN